MKFVLPSSQLKRMFKKFEGITHGPAQRSCDNYEAKILNEERKRKVKLKKKKEIA